MKLCIENVPHNATEREVRQLFSGYGKVRSVELTPDPGHGEQPGTAQIELEDVDIKDIGVLPDRCLFKGSVIRVIQASRVEGPESSGNPVALPDQSTAVSRGSHNRARNTLRVISVEKVVDPNTGQSNGWCRYTITSLAGSITGMRQGSVADVTLHAEEAAEAFNLRNMLGHGRPPAWSSRHKK